MRPRATDTRLPAWPGAFMSNPPNDKRPQAPRADRPRTAAQRASDANRLQQLAVHGHRPQPSDRRSLQPGEKSEAGLDNDQRPVGVNKRR